MRFRSVVLARIRIMSGYTRYTVLKPHRVFERHLPQVCMRCETLPPFGVEIVGMPKLRQHAIALQLQCRWGISLHPSHRI